MVVIGICPSAGTRNPPVFAIAEMKSALRVVLKQTKGDAAFGQHPLLE
jgi:hypothetical protein